MIKVNTIEQFEILKHIEENFFVDTLEISIFDTKTLKIVDKNKKEGYFFYSDGKIIFSIIPF
mgnify:CR=1 FL=1